jgi:hypothetical protein
MHERTNTVQVTKEGRRYYLSGNTFPIKDKLRAAGAHWDRDRSSWWTSKESAALEFAAEVNAQGAELDAVRAATAGEELVAIEGNTYPIKDKLRAMGGTWDAGAKVWRVPSSKAEEAKALVAAQPAKASADYTQTRQYSGAQPKRSFGVRRNGGRCRGCKGPIVNASHCHAQGGYCGSCAFDEF